MKKLKILYLSSIPLTNTTGGSAVMYNHLVNDTFTVCALDETAFDRNFFSVQPLVNLELRLQNSRLYYWVQTVRHLSVRRLLTSEHLKKMNDFSPDMVVTVAHGELFWLAMKAAQKLNVPLVSVFHDWWPEICDRDKKFPSFYRKIVDERFRKLHSQSNCSICITGAMMEELGPNKKSVVLLPCSQLTDVPHEQVTGQQPFRLIYAGNIMAGYGEQIIRLMDVFPLPRVRFSIIGNSWDWPRAKVAEGNQKGILHLPMYGDEFEKTLSGASAFLVVLDFNKACETWTRTLFPSKIASYAKFGKPIILWGPANSSGAKFLAEQDLGIVISDPDPGIVIQKIKQLESSLEMQAHYAQKARYINQSFLNPTKIQQQFVAVLQSVTNA